LVDNELKDLKTTVLVLGTRMKSEPFNTKIRSDYFTHCKKFGGNGETELADLSNTKASDEFSI
jgi:hypothetical protein